MTTSDDSERPPESTRSKSQFNVRGILLLTAAFAIWFFLLPELRQELIAPIVFWTLAIIGGAGGHLVYTYLLPWRGTVVISLIVCSVVVFAAVLAAFGDLGALGIVLMPIDVMSHQSWSNRAFVTAPVLACIAIFTAAHPIRPCLINAIITAIGVSMWYAFALLIAASAG